MSNFFNAIGVADMEKVHSAMIAWILDDVNDHKLPNYTMGSTNFSTLPIEKRSELLCELFNVKPTRKFDTIRTYVEWNDIDIMIETTDKVGTEVWVVENKLKSQEHLSNVTADQIKRWRLPKTTSKIWQTEKYVHIVNDHHYSKAHYMLLSLGGDTAECTSPHWEVCTYEKLHKLLSRLLPVNGSNPLIEEYNNSIGKLIVELDDFIMSPGDYDKVFAKKLTKADKAKLLASCPSFKERYILENGLETIFQKQFLKEYIKKAGLGTFPISIDDDNGIAEFDCTLYPYKDSMGEDMYLQVQFQAGTFKAVLIHEKYRNNERRHFDEIYGKPIWSGSWYKKFVATEMLLNPTKKTNAWRLHLAQKTASSLNPKPRIALDKKMPVIKGKKWFDYKDSTIIKVFKDCFAETVRVVNLIK
jgi:hypothetical protein